jgi:hypothetical protein
MRLISVPWVIRQLADGLLIDTPYWAKQSNGEAFKTSNGEAIIPSNILCQL